MNAQFEQNIDRMPVPQPVIDHARTILAEALVSVTIARDFKIETAEDAQIAAEQLSGIAKFIKAQNDKRLEFKRPVIALGQDIDAEFNPALEKATEADKLLRQHILAWNQAETKRVNEANAKAEAARQEEIRKTRDALEKEQARVATLKRPDAVERSLEKIEEASANIAVAESRSTQVATATKLSGTSSVQTWFAEYGDIHALIKAAAENPKLAMYLSFNEKVINAQVKVTKGNTDIPGVFARTRDSLRVR